MKKILTKIVLIVSLIILTNVLSWLLFGLNGTYHLAINQIGEENIINYLHSEFNPDTLYILINQEGGALSHEDGEDLRRFDDASKRKQKAIENYLIDHFNISQLILIDSKKYFNRKDNNPAIDFSVYRLKPLYCEIESSLFDGDGSNLYLGKYIYLFGWREVYPYSDLGTNDWKIIQDIFD